jgi:hypothetical protein
MQWSKDLKKKLAAILIGITIALIFLEILLRIFPNRFTDYGSTIRFMYADTIGIKYMPNQKVGYNSECFKISPVSTNSNGFRDIKTTKAHYPIAVLGDSFMSALEVPEGVYTARQIESITGADTLNAGITAYGTLHQYLVYEEYVKKYKPQVVLLFFYTQNDIEDNSYSIMRKIYGSTAGRRAAAYIKDGEVFIVPASPDKFLEGTEKYWVSYIKKEMGKICKTCVVIKRVWDYYSVNRNLTSNSEDGDIPISFKVYMPPQTDEWKEAWELTEIFLKKINDAVARNGGAFVVVSVPEYVRTSREWKKEMEKQYNIDILPEEFDPFYPVKRLQRITQKHKIEFLELESHFLRYREKFNLQAPYYFYYCDGHWNPLGHFLASNIVAKHLVENDILEVESKDKVLSLINENLNLDPLAVLGNDAFMQIYNKGIYKGETNILKILKRQKER